MEDRIWRKKHGGGAQCYMGSPNSVVMCVDDMEKHQPKGRFYHAYSRQGVKFANVEQLLFGLEQFYDWIKFPYPGTNDRTFTDMIKVKKPDCNFEERTRIMKDEELLSRHGELGTFIIRVQHRQNSSWQGRVTWMDEDKTVYFRSIWELIKLMDSALDTVCSQENGQDMAGWPEA